MKNIRLLYILFLVVSFVLGVFAKGALDNFRVTKPKPRILSFEKMFLSDPPPPPYLEDADISASMSAELEVQSQIREKFDVRPGAELQVIISPRLGGYKALIELPEGVNLSQSEFEMLVSEAKANGFRQWARLAIELEKKKEGIPPISAQLLKEIVTEPNKALVPTPMSVTPPAGQEARQP